MLIITEMFLKLRIYRKRESWYALIVRGRVVNAEAAAFEILSISLYSKILHVILALPYHSTNGTERIIVSLFIY